MQLKNSQKYLLNPVSILMPVCNEADIIEEVIEEWVTDVFRYLPDGSELVLDDASSDGTTQILYCLAKKYSYIHIYHQDHKDGFFKSAMRLYRAAECPLIFFTDSDGQYIPSEFWKLVPYINDYDMVHGAKINRKDSLYRIFASFCFNKIANLLFGCQYPDINSAFRLMHRSVVDKLLDKVQHMPTLINAELLLRGHIEGFTIKSLWVAHRKRKFGVSRGLPLNTFLSESLKAYYGLLKIKTEYSVLKFSK
jgi:glycosyltransferase involved in cell wall biosynthesis